MVAASDDVVCGKKIEVHLISGLVMNSRIRPSKAKCFARSLVADYWIYVLCGLAIGFTIWTRSFIPFKYLTWSFAIFFAVALWFDLTQPSPSSQRAKFARHLIPAGLLLLGVLSMLFALFEAWENHYVSWWSAGPLLPYSDAGGYVNGARSLLTFGRLGEWAGRRPLGICLMSAVLGLADQNYQAALIFVALLAGLSTFFAAQETWRAGGLSPAVIYVIFCYFSMRQWLPLFLTETPGFIFGSISFTFLLAGFRLRSFLRTLYGFGFLILAITTRGGAMLVIPFLALYLLYYFSRNFRDAFRKGIAIAAVGGALLALSPLLVMRLAPAGTEYQGNLSYTLYGLAAGGKGWSYVLREHPELDKIPTDGEKARYIYSLFRKRVSEDPSLFLTTLLRNFDAAILNFPRVFYGMMSPLPPAIPGALALVALGLLAIPALRRESPWTFLLPVAIGVVLSAPFLTDAAGRVFAATMPLHAALAASAIPLAICFRRQLRKRSRVTSESSVVQTTDPLPSSAEGTSPPPWVELGFAALLFGAVTVFPLIASLRPVPNSILSWSQSKGEGFRKEVVFYYNPGAGTLLGSQRHVTGVMNAPVTAVTANPMFERELSAANHLAEGDYLYHAFFLQEPDYGNILVRFNGVPNVRPGYLKVVVRLLEKGGGGFFYVADSFTPVDP